MKILCPAQGITPAVILCQCKYAVELETNINRCAICGREYTKDGCSVAPTLEDTDADS